MGQPDTGDTAWMLASSALVLLMTPGLAFFYGGMTRAKSVLNMMMMSFVTASLHVSGYLTSSGSYTPDAKRVGVETQSHVLVGSTMQLGNQTGSLARPNSDCRVSCMDVR